MEKCFKVICKESNVYGFVAGKIYNVKNGILTSDLGNEYGPFENVHEINRDRVVSNLARFCEFVDYTTYNRVSVRTSSYYNRVNPFEIEDVIFNGPATIVKWTDGTKTVVKAQDGEEFDPEKGLAMAFAKKAMGNKGLYFNVIKKWTEKYEEDKKQTEQFIRGKFVNVPNVIKTSDDE